MKTSGKQSRKHTDIYPPAQTAAKAADNFHSARADGGQDLPQPVRKHFADEIGDTLREAPQAMAGAKSRLTRSKPQQDKEMSALRFTRGNASFVGIRETGSSCVSPDTDKHEKDSTHAIDLEALRVLSPIVLAIQKRIDAGAKFGNDSQECADGNPSSAKTDGPNSSEDLNPDAAEAR